LSTKIHVVYGGILSTNGSFTNCMAVLCAAQPELEGPSVADTKLSSCAYTARCDSKLPPSEPLDSTSAVTATSNRAQVCCRNTFLFASTFPCKRNKHPIHHDDSN
jgi:hypothetical protein